MDSNSSILVVNASEYMRDYIQGALKKQGHKRTLVAVDGKDALDMLMEHKVSLIITDLDMPKVSGLDLVKALSDHSVLKSIPCIITTPEISSDNFKEAMQAGAADYIKKPFTSSELDIKIKAIQHKKEANL
jgi:two-component system chemotaxis response regulator CheY